MTYFRILCYFVFCVGTVALGTVPAGSQGFALAVTPAKLEMEMKPGSAYNLPITIHNDGAGATHIQAAMIDFGLTKNGDYIFENVGKRPYSLMRYASINPREFDLGGGMTQQVRLSLDIPDKPLTGEYAGIVMFQTRPVRRAGAVAFSARVTTKVYMTIPGTAHMDGAVVKMDAAEGPAGQIYRVLFKNTGNTHVYLSGQVQVLKNGSIVDRIAIPDSLLVERSGDRLIQVSGKTLPSGKYEAIAMVDYGGKTMTGGEVVFSVK